MTTLCPSPPYLRLHCRLWKLNQSQLRVDPTLVRDPLAELWCPCRRHGSPQIPLTLTPYNRTQERPDIGVNLVERFQKEGASFKCFVWNGVQFEWQFFFPSQKPFCLFLLPPLYFSICHFNYSPAAYFYTSNAISRNTRERAVKILGCGSEDRARLQEGGTNLGHFLF